MDRVLEALAPVREDGKDLVARSRAGDRAAFDALCSRLRPRLETAVRLRLCAPRRSLLDPEDVLQESLLRAWRKIAVFTGADEAALFRWISGIATRVILEEAGRKGREMQPLDFEVEDPDRVSPGKALQREERLHRLQECLDALSPDYREALLLVWVEGLRVHEIARKMDRTPNAVSHLILRALRRLRQDFGDTGSLGLPDLPVRWKEGPTRGD